MKITIIDIINYHPNISGKIQRSNLWLWLMNDSLLIKMSTRNY